MDGPFLERERESAAFAAGRRVRDAPVRRRREVFAVEQALAGRLRRSLRRLQALADRSPFEVAVNDRGRVKSMRLACRLNPPAATDAIAETELQLGTALPPDYARFLLYANGATLFMPVEPEAVSEIGGAELLGTAVLVQQAEAMELDYRAGCIPELVVFALIGADGDRLAFETGRMSPYGGCGVLEARRDHRPDQWWVIARDFTSWLEELLRGAARSRAPASRLWGAELAVEQPELPLEDEDDLAAVAWWSNHS